ALRELLRIEGQEERHRVARPELRQLDLRVAHRRLVEQLALGKPPPQAVVIHSGRVPLVLAPVGLRRVIDCLIDERAVGELVSQLAERLARLFVVPLGVERSPGEQHGVVHPLRLGIAGHELGRARDRLVVEHGLLRVGPVLGIVVHALSRVEVAFGRIVRVEVRAASRQEDGERGRRGQDRKTETRPLHGVRASAAATVSSSCRLRTSRARRICDSMAATAAGAAWIGGPQGTPCATAAARIAFSSYRLARPSGVLMTRCTPPWAMRSTTFGLPSFTLYTRSQSMPFIERKRQVPRVARRWNPKSASLRARKSAGRLSSSRSERKTVPAVGSDSPAPACAL